jgi:SET domain-containing protein
MEAFILNLAIDFNRLLNKGLNFTEIMEELNKKKEKYHPKVLITLNEMIQKEVKRDIRSYTISSIEPGMIFMQNVMTESGSQIISKGQEASNTLLVRLKNITRRMKVIEPIKVLLQYKMNIFE